MIRVAHSHASKFAASSAASYCKAGAATSS